MVVAEEHRVPVGAGVSVRVLARSPQAPLTPVLLVHGLSSSARLWDGVAGRLAARGHPVAAVDQRGHGLSDKPDSGYDYATLTADLLSVLEYLGWSRPYAAGQSWGGNVVLELAARHPGAVCGIALVDGGTIDLAARFPDWESCAAALAPPPLDGMDATRFERLIRAQHPDWPEEAIAGTLANVEVVDGGRIRPRLSRENHLQILRQMWDHRPSDSYPLVTVPVLLVPADDPREPAWTAGKREGVAKAQAALARARVTTCWVTGDHDLHAQHPEQIAQLIHEAAVAVT